MDIKSFIVGLILAALLATGLILRMKEKHRGEVGNLQSLIEVDKGVLTQWENEKNEAIAVARLAQVSLAEYQTSHPAEIAQILADFGIKPANLRSFLTTSFKAMNQGTSVIHTVIVPPDSAIRWITKTDSTKQLESFDIADGYLSLHGNIADLKVNWRYQYIDTLTFIGSTRRKNIFAQQTYWIDGMVKNKNARIESIRNVQITEFKDKRWSVGPAALFDPFSGTVKVGISIQYGLIRF